MLWLLCIVCTMSDNVKCAANRILSLYVVVSKTSSQLSTLVTIFIFTLTLCIFNQHRLFDLLIDVILDGELSGIG